MPTPRFHDVVATKEALREIVGHPSELVVRKQLTRLDQHARRFIELSPFLVIGTSGNALPCSGQSDAAASPSARQVPPAAQSHAVGTRFDRWPASGAAAATVSGQGVK